MGGESSRELMEDSIMAEENSELMKLKAENDMKAERLRQQELVLKEDNISQKMAQLEERKRKESEEMYEQKMVTEDMKTFARNNELEAQEQARMVESGNMPESEHEPYDRQADMKKMILQKLMGGF